MPTSFQAVLDDVKTRSTDLKSILELLLYRGKAAEAVQRFGAAEEVRISMLLEEVIFRS